MLRSDAPLDPLIAAPPSTVDPGRELDRVWVREGQAGAYQWWYFDGVSDDGRYSFVAIFFIGGVFSPLYADRLAAGIRADPYEHPMVNLAVYEHGRRKAWVFSEYPREEVRVAEASLDLNVARSSVWRRPGGYELTIHDDDFPARRPVKAKIELFTESEAIAPKGLALSPDGRHQWGAPAPNGRVVFRSDSLGLSFRGRGYHDVNRGSEPLHAGWRQWSWGRAHLGHETCIYYDAETSRGERSRLLFTAEGGRLQTEQLPAGAEARTLTPWLLRPPSRWSSPSLDIEPGATLESSPFYLRQLSTFRRNHQQGPGMCEYLDLTRFARPSVRFMLRHRIYRRPAPGAPPLPVQVHRRKVFPDDPL